MWVQTLQDPTKAEKSPNWRKVSKSEKIQVSKSEKNFKTAKLIMFIPSKPTYMKA